MEFVIMKVSIAMKAKIKEALLFWCAMKFVRCVPLPLKLSLLKFYASILLG